MNAPITTMRNGDGASKLNCHVKQQNGVIFSPISKHVWNDLRMSWLLNRWAGTRLAVRTLSQMEVITKPKSKTSWN